MLKTYDKLQLMETICGLIQFRELCVKDLTCVVLQASISQLSSDLNLTFFSTCTSILLCTTIEIA